MNPNCYKYTIKTTRTIAFRWCNGKCVELWIESSMVRISCCCRHELLFSVWIPKATQIDEFSLPQVGCHGSCVVECTTCLVSVLGGCGFAYPLWGKASETGYTHDWFMPLLRRERERQKNAGLVSELVGGFSLVFLSIYLPLYLLWSRWGPVDWS